jgi:hypothetical protein
MKFMHMVVPIFLLMEWHKDWKGVLVSVGGGSITFVKESRGAQFIGTFTVGSE